MCDMPYFRFVSSQNIKPVTINVSASDLGSQEYRWLSTHTANSEQITSAGTVINSITSGSADSTSMSEYLIEFRLEFKTPIDVSLSAHRNNAYKLGISTLGEKPEKKSDSDSISWRREDIVVVTPPGTPQSSVNINNNNISLVSVRKKIGEMIHSPPEQERKQQRK